MPSLAIDAKYKVNTAFSSDNVLVIDRGDDAQMRFVLNLSKENVPLSTEMNDYQVLIDHELNDNMSLNPWGLLVLTK